MKGSDIVATSRVTFPDLSKDRFARDLCECLDAWYAYAEARFGKPVQVRLTRAQLEERFGMKDPPGNYETYTHMETAPGWSEAHDHFTVAWMTARGHRLDLTSGNWHTWES